ncbi:MAG: peptide chain release factor 1 [Tenericutes bacterium HGW-Tenericutes-4]|nr:MAG: peptide chain release factor 1 [Tenericutes bacterium HGW-Tenericutes-4]
MISKLQKIKDRYEEVNSLLMDPNTLSNQKEYVKLAKEQKNLLPIVELYNEYNKTMKDLNDSTELIKQENEDDMIEFLKSEIEAAKENIEAMQERLKILLLPKDENDDKNVIIEIRAGAGGDEASLFGAAVMRMYLRYAEIKRYKVEIMDVSETEVGGVKEATFLIKGNSIYAKFKYESGVHRVQRVPETESQGRVHTSTITVAVLPEVEELDFEINTNDLRIDTYRSGGAGGQHVNTTDSAVRITHLPTGLVVQCQNERSQIKNRETAMHMLYSKLTDYYQTQKDAEYSKNRKVQVGTGDRSERIRTYNYPQGRLTDHRINYTAYNLPQVLDGDIEELIVQLEMADHKAKLENATNLK